jgi:phage N-6-adenine-methyltransferase
VSTELVQWENIERQIDEVRDVKTIVEMHGQMEAIKQLSRQVDGSVRTMNKAGKYKFYLEQKAGELYKTAKPVVNQHQKSPSSSLTTTKDIQEETGKSRQTLNTWATEAEVEKDTVEEYEAVCNDDGKEFTSAGAVRYAEQKQKNPALYTSNSHEWYTPQEVIDCVLNLFGFIDLDPCSNSKESPNVPAAHHYTANDNGLALDWFGRVYMNPPYGNELKNWIGKLKQEYLLEHIQEAIALVPARTDTAWFRELKEFPKCFIWGRLKFSGSNPAPFPSMAVYFGTSILSFQNAFSKIGDVYIAYDAEF